MHRPNNRTTRLHAIFIAQKTLWLFYIVSSRIYVSISFSLFVGHVLSGCNQAISQFVFISSRTIATRDVCHKLMSSLISLELV